MTLIDLRKRVSEGVFLLDGAMGTQIIERGISAGRCNDYLNIESPDVICEIHKAYLQAGSNAVITNTFGANRYALARHKLEQEAANINKAGAKIAKRAAGDEKCVLGDIGPTGDFLEPLGTLKTQDCKAAFSEQARDLFDSGVDGFIIETMTALDEMAIAVEAVKEISGSLPVFASMAFDKTKSGFRTMMGVGIEQMAAEVIPLGIDAIGFNCGNATLDEYVELAEKLVSSARQISPDIIIYAEPNAGKPEMTESGMEYKVMPQEFAAAAKKIHSAGVNIIGGCCGTTPAHIAEVAKQLSRT